MVGRVILLAALLVLTGCAGREVDTRPVAAAWTADVRAMGEGGHGGFATASIMVDGDTRINVTLSGGSPGGDHPWGVYTGGCGTDGTLVGLEDAYPTLRPNQAGNASATATLDVALDPEESYHVEIHQSANDDDVVGCGELILAG